MATIEFLRNRFQKAQEQLSKKENTFNKKSAMIVKKVDQINKMGYNWMDILKSAYSSDKTFQKAQELAWSVDTLTDDVKTLQKSLEGLRTKVAKYEAELQEAEEKANSRNVKVILDFLEAWKEKVRTYYIGHTEDWIRSLMDYYREDHKYVEWYNSHFEERKNKELMKEIKKPVEKAKAIHAKFNYLDPYMHRSNGSYTLDIEKLNKDLDQEADRKYDFIIERTNEIVGQITDASGLTIGQKDDLNGFIVGTRGVASVQTIGAGGYNIQCFHFRTLIHKVK